MFPCVTIERGVSYIKGGEKLHMVSESVLTINGESCKKAQYSSETRHRRFGSSEWTILNRK